MEWKLGDEQKKQYDSMVSNAQDLEANIGSSQVRVYKLIKMRDELDGVLKTWWDKVIKDMGLDPKADYMISREGIIKDVTRPSVVKPVAPEAPTAPESAVGTNASEIV